MYRIEEDEDSVIVLASSFREFMNFSNIFLFLKFSVTTVCGLASI